MAEFFTAEYQWLWSILLTLALFFPVRNLIWTLAIRRAVKKAGEIDDAARLSLKKRAGISAVLLGFVFSYFYTLSLF